MFCAFSLLALLQAKAISTATVTVQIEGGGSVSPNYNGQTLVLGQKYTLTAKPKAGFKFTGWTGSLTSSGAKLTFVLSNDMALTASFLDTQPPTLRIAPVLKSWGTNIVSNDVYVVTGKAKDNGTIAQVYFKTNGGDWQPAMTGNAWSNWWANVTLVPDVNTIFAYAVDTAGNVSKTSKLKVVYTASQPNLYYPIEATMVVTNAGELVEIATFSTNTFTDITGAGTYTYKRIDPVTGKLTMKYIAPPSAANTENNVNVTMHYDRYYSGTFTDAEGTNIFFLYETEKNAPPTLNNSTITFTNDGGDLTVINFLRQPNVVAGENPYQVSNPMIVPLDSGYPGEVGDRVKIIFDHQQKSDTGPLIQVGTPAYDGTVINIYSNSVNVLFDNSSFVTGPGKYGPLADKPLDILTYYYKTYSGGTQITNGVGTFTYTNYTWIGSLLQLAKLGENHSIILTFTNDSSAGIYFDETHFADSTVDTTIGSFGLAIAPQIVTQPQDYTWTDGGTATFTVEARGTPVMVYQWRLNGTNLADGATGSGSTITGSSTPSLTIDSLTAADLGAYTVVITNDYGSVTSSIASLAPGIAPHISADPQDTTVTSGQTANFSVTASGSAPLAYQWRVGGVEIADGNTGWGSSIAGSKTSSLTISTVTTNDVGSYQVVITNSFGSVTSSIANLNVLVP